MSLIIGSKIGRHSRSFDLKNGILPSYSLDKIFVLEISPWITKQRRFKKALESNF
jgi:hypothetical protein